MLRRGDIAARAAEQSGQAWAGAAQNIAGTIGAIPQQMQQAKTQTLQTQGLQQNVDQGARAASDMKALDAAYLQPGGRDAIINALPGHLRPQVQKQFTEADEAAAKVQETALKVTEAQNEYLGGLAANIRDHGYDPSSAQLAISHAKQTYAGNPDMLKQISGIEQQFQSDPSKIRPIVDQLVSVSAKQKAADSAATTAAARALAAGRPTPASLASDAAGGDPTMATDLLHPKPIVKPPAVGTFEDYVTRKFGANPTPAQIEQGRKAYGDAGRVTVVTPTGPSDVKETIAGMKDGTIPPQLPGRASKEYIALMAEAHRAGYDLASAAQDWTATQKHLATLNGAQQTRLRQAISTASDSLGVIEDLAKQWDGGKFPTLNKGMLATAKAGMLGAKAQQIATNLEAQITDVTSELGNVYMGGNSPTDHALGLAQKNLSAEWTKDQLLSAIKLARTNLQIRNNSIAQSTPVLSTLKDNSVVPTMRFNPTTGKVEPIK